MKEVFTRHGAICQSSDEHLKIKLVSIDLTSQLLHCQFGILRENWNEAFENVEVEGLRESH